MTSPPERDGWRRLVLKDLAQVVYGRPKPLSNGPYPVIGSGGPYGRTADALCKDATLVIGRKGTAGTVWLSKEGCWPSDTTFYLAGLRDDVNIDYLYYRFLHAPLSGEHARTTLPSLQRPDLETYLVPLPSTKEQRAIARVLSLVEDAIAARRRELELEREHKAVLTEHLFTYGTRREALKQTEIGEMPESWRVASISELATVVSGGTPDRSRPEYWGGGIPWVKTGEINYRPIMQTEESITDLGLAESSARIIPSGTILMAMYGQGVTRGRVALLEIDAAINQACAALLADGRVKTLYLYQYLVRAYEAIRNLGHGANQKNLNAGMIRSVRVPLPPVDEQQKIAETLSACDAKIAAVDREIALHDELFRALLEELMSGRLSTRPLIDSSAA